jgi:hypothetical protein
MEDKINKAIETALDQFRTNLRPEDALNQAHAILMLMQARSQWVTTMTDPAATKRVKAS